MSPNEYNEDIFSLRERETTVTDIRSSYSFIFNQLVQIYKIYHQDEKLSAKAEEVADAVETLHNEGKLTDYLYENFKSCYSQYPTMLVSNLLKEKEQVGADKQYERLKKLKGLLKLYIGDLSEELHELIEEQNDVEKRALIREYFNQI